MALVGNGSPLFLSGLALIAVGLILHIVGMATPYWLSLDLNNSHMGLWLTCADFVCVSLADVYSNDSIRTCEAFSILAIFPASAALSCCVIHVVHTSLTDVTRRLYVTIAIVLNCFSVICILICILVWRFGDWVLGNVSVSYLGYSFYLSLIGLIALCLSNALLRLYARRMVQGIYQVLP